MCFDLPAENASPFLFHRLFLRLTRACLGKMIGFSSDEMAPKRERPLSRTAQCTDDVACE
jgi:hypothetical protein